MSAVLAEQEEMVTVTATEFQKINQEWVKACESAIFDCPAEFVPQFTSLMFTGQRLITEARITAQIDGARAEAISRL